MLKKGSIKKNQKAILQKKGTDDGTSECELTLPQRGTYFIIQNSVNTQPNNNKSCDKYDIDRLPIHNHSDQENYNFIKNT